MCGITGYFGEVDHSNALESSLKLLRHRGPDGLGKFFAKPTKETFLGLGHTRLSIMDTSSKAGQPIISANEDSIVIFNGEIYNFKYLRELLPNHEWRTRSDSEVVVELLNHFGQSAFALFNGMYAIAWYKKSTGQLVLARDPLGIKPLYLHINENTITFASEIKALAPFGIVPEICQTDFLEFLNFGYVHEPNTGFSNVIKVYPGEYLLWGNGVRCSEKICAFSGPPAITNDPQHLIFNAIKGQKDADVAVGTFYSGGIDSTALLGTIRSRGLYINSNKESEKNIELMRAQKLSKELGVELEVADLNSELTVEQFCEHVSIIASKIEEPISDYTYIASQQVAQLARQRGFVVMFSGMGGDEFFAGYPRYVFLDWLWLCRWAAFFARIAMKLPGLRKVFVRSKKIERFISFFSEKNFVWAYARVIGYLTTAEINELLQGDPELDRRNKTILKKLNRIASTAPKQDPLSKALSLDQKGFLAHNLIVTDKSSMQESIEVRVPLLDLSILNGWFNNTKLRKKFPNTGKVLLLNCVKQLFGRNVNFGRKEGFNPPLEDIISKFTRSELKQMILTPAFTSFLNEAPVERILDNHFSGRNNNTYKIWQLIFISNWLQIWSPSKNS